MFFLYTNLVNGGWWLIRQDDKLEDATKHANRWLTEKYIILERESDQKLYDQERLVPTDKLMEELCQQHQVTVRSDNSEEKNEEEKQIS